MLCASSPNFRELEEQVNKVWKQGALLKRNDKEIMKLSDANRVSEEDEKMEEEKEEKRQEYKERKEEEEVQNGD